MDLQKHQRELFELEKEELKPKDWIPMDMEESKEILGSARKMRSGK